MCAKRRKKTVYKYVSIYFIQYLDCLWAQIKNLRGNKWIEKQITRPYLAFDGVLCDALQHTLPQIIPPSHNKSVAYPLPRVVFRLFDYTDVPQVKRFLNTKKNFFCKSSNLVISFIYLYYRNLELIYFIYLFHDRLQ